MGLFTDFAKDLPDGAFWATGAWFKRFAAQLDADRARLAQTSGSEIPDASGRWFIINGGTGKAAVLPPFKLKVVNSTHLRVVLSTIANGIPTGFAPDDSTPFILAVSGSGFVYGEIAYDPDSGAISSRTIKAAGAVPDNDGTHTRCTLGGFTTTAGVLSVANAAYGPINANACQDWFVEGNPWSVALFASGLPVTG